MMLPHTRRLPLLGIARVLLTSLLLLEFAAAPAGAQEAANPAEGCDDKPVYMIVAGVTLDVERMAEYARRIRETGIYAKLGGYYVNLPRPIAVFEGDAPDDYVSLIVRFPCLENARRFWNSRIYQETIKPLRLNPSAGDYLVTVYREADLPEYMRGRVSEAQFLEEFDARAVEQTTPQE